MAVAYSPLFAALFFLVSNVLRIITMMRWVYRSHHSVDLKETLDPDYLKEEWAFRESNNPLYQAFNVTNLFAWLLLTVPMMQLAWCLSMGGKRKVAVNGAIAMLTLAGCFTEFVSRLMVFGDQSAAIFVAQTFNLDFWLPSDVAAGVKDGMGWRALELTHLIVRGLSTFVDAFEWISLFLVLLLVAYSVQTMQQRVMSIWWARFGIIIAFLALFDFAANVLIPYDRHTFILLASFLSILNTTIFLPIYLTMMAFGLPQAMPVYRPGEDPNYAAN